MDLVRFGRNTRPDFILQNYNLWRTSGAPFGWMFWTTDNGHPERALFQKFETFGLGQTNWAVILGGILAISSQTIGTILAL